MRAKKGSWIVRLKCTVTKEVITSDCTEEEARNEPFEHAIDEMEVDQEDWEVRSVQPNE